MSWEEMTLPRVCTHLGCATLCVSGSNYCEDHLIEAQLKARRPAPMGTLAQLIRGAKAKGLIAPVAGGYGHS
jgi:hypothetical protein